jgi:hypothetical protein
VQIACNVDGTVRWTANVFNSAACQTVGAYAVPLLVRQQNGRLFIVQIDAGTRTFQPGANVLQGNFCYPFAPNTQSVQAYFTLLTNACIDFASSNTIAPCPVTPSCPLRLTDVPPAHKYYDEIMSIAAIEAVSGFQDRTFKPDSEITRGEAVKMLVQAFGLPVEESKTQRFRDVPPGSPYYAYIEAAYKEGLISGYKDGTFKPEQAITRGAAVKLVVQAASWVPVQPAQPTFADVRPDSPFYSYIEAAQAHGLLTGMAEAGGSFEAGRAASRGEGAALVARAASSLMRDVPRTMKPLLEKLLPQPPARP